MRSIPFISSAPLDILAGIFFLMSVLTVFLGTCIIISLVFSLLNVDLYLDYKGYDLMLIKTSGVPRGIGVNFLPGFEVWKYTNKGRQGIVELKLFPA